MIPRHIDRGMFKAVRCKAYDIVEILLEDNGYKIKEFESLYDMIHSDDWVYIKPLCDMHESCVDQIANMVFGWNSHLAPYTIVGLVADYNYIPKCQADLDNTLHSISITKNMDAAKSLLDRGIYNKRLSNSDNVYFAALETKRWDVLDELVRLDLRTKRAIDYPLSFQLINHSYYRTKKVLEFGADPNGSDGCWSIESICGNNKKTNIMKLYIKHGFDVNIRGGRALNVSATTGSLDMMRVLIDAGADVNIDNGMPLIQSLHCYYGNGDLTAAELLVDHGANPDVIIKRYKYVQQHTWIKKPDLMRVYEQLSDRYKSKFNVEVVDEKK